LPPQAEGGELATSVGGTNVVPGGPPAKRRTGLAVVPAGPADGSLASPRRAFGHTLDRTSVVDEEAVAIREAARRVLEGDTLSAVVGDWNRRGLTTANGGPWRVNSLSSLLVQPRLAGLAGDLTPLADGRYPAIVDPGTHDRLVALHADRRKGPRRPTRRYLLTGLLRCWRCGGGLRGMPRSKGADLYVCPGPPHGGCSGTAVTADRADDAVRDLVLARLDSPALAEGAGPTDRRTSAHQADVRRAVSALAGHRQRLDDLADMWASGEISRAEWLSLKRKVGGRAKEAEAEAERLGRVDAFRALAGTGRTLRRTWPAMTVDEQRAVLRAALARVVVLAAEPPKQVFRPERLQPTWLE
jgi:hypothetical protein